MSEIVIRRSRFNWHGFAQAVTRFAATCGFEEAYPVVDDGRVVAWQDHDEVGDVPAHPLRRLEAGFSLFAAFTAFRTAGLLACADGGVIPVPDFGADDAVPPTDEWRRLAEKTECCERRCYGLLISLDRGKLILQTALMTDADGDCTAEAVAEAGLADEPMGRFVRGFTRRSRT